MKITPLYHNLIVKVIDESNRTAGGLHIPDIARAGVTARGEVLAAGDGRASPEGKLTPLCVKVGDVILFARGGTQAIPFDPHPDGSVLYMPENNVIAILTELERGTGIIGTDGSEVMVKPGQVAS